MNNFQSVLLCTDLDGTLANGNTIPEKNIEAINYFIANGGTFTLCTGRIVSYLKEDILKLIQPNTYIITLNGAKIVNHITGETLYNGFLKPGYYELYSIAEKYKEYINDIYIYYKDRPQSTKTSPINFKRDCIDAEFLVHKIVFTFNDEETTLKAKCEIKAKFNGKYECLRSWNTGLEVLDKSSTKGFAVKRLKDKLNKPFLVTVGDYENDISMIEAADIGYAVENAIDDVKGAATRVTRSQSDNALAAVINDLSTLPQFKI